MPATLKLHADEGGTYTVCIACTNDAGGADIPQTLNWTLTDSVGGVINSRKEVDIPGPAAEEEVKLIGDDLAMQAGEVASEVSRIFTTKGTDSTGDPIRGRSRFILDNYIVLPIV
ncbi:MAG: hypothetical protein IMF19_11280 [Proteobacteria bacterium]|nr:hypothetical protein [Pseudomonadota bacterium]